MSFWSKKAKFLLKSSQKRQLLQISCKNPFQKGIGWISRQFWYIKLKKTILIIPLLEPTRGFFLLCKKIGILGALSEFWEPQFLGILGALKFGIMGVHQFFEKTRLPFDLLFSSNVPKIMLNNNLPKQINFFQWPLHICQIYHKFTA